MSDDEDQSKSIKGLIDLGSSITGNASSAAIRFLLGGPAGAVVGAMVGPAIVAAMKKIGGRGETLSSQLLSIPADSAINAIIIYHNQFGSTRRTSWGIQLCN